MSLVKQLIALSTAPARVGLSIADASLGVATTALGLARQALGDAGKQGANSSMAHMLGLDDTIARANRLAKLMDDDAPLGRALAPGGPADRLLAPGGLVDQLTGPGGVIDFPTSGGVTTVTPDFISTFWTAPARTRCPGAPHPAGRRRSLSQTATTSVRPATRMGNGRYCMAAGV